MPKQDSSSKTAKSSDIIEAVVTAMPMAHASVPDSPDTSNQAITPTKSRGGRKRSVDRLPTNPDLFAGGSVHRMASSRVIWEGANILTQQDDLPWRESSDGLCYESEISRGRGYLAFWLTQDLASENPSVLESEAALALIEQFDIRAACMHLIYSAYATQIDAPWKDQFVLDDRQLERYLGLEKNTNMNRQEKLHLMLQLAKQPCHLLVYLSYPQQGRVPSFSVSRTRLWEIAEPILHFQECLEDKAGNAIGEQTLVGFTLNIRCGNWAKYFLNEEMRRKREGYYEFGVLSQQILQDLMSTWHHHEAAARLMTWLLFKTKVNRDSPLTVEGLLRVAFGEHELHLAKSNFRDRDKVVRKWKTSLKVLLKKGWTIQPDPDTYPTQYWVEDAALNQIPDDPTEALEFWAEDASAEIGTRLTDRVKQPRGQFERLLRARLWIQPPQIVADKLDEIEASRKVPNKIEAKRQLPSREPASQVAQLTSIKTGVELRDLRLAKNLTQSDLAEQLGVSLSWVKLIETQPTRKILPKYQPKLIEILG